MFFQTGFGRMNIINGLVVTIFLQETNGRKAHIKSLIKNESVINLDFNSRKFSSRL